MFREVGPADRAPFGRVIFSIAALAFIELVNQLAR